MLPRAPAAALDVALLERREAPAPILAHRFDQREVGSAGRTAAQLDLIVVFAPVGHVRHEIDAELTAGHQDATDRIERRREIAVAEQRLQDPVGCQHHREDPRPERQGADVTAGEMKSIGRFRSR